MIPMVDLKKQLIELQPEIDKGLRQVLEDCQFILGPNVQQFEAEVAEFLGVKHAVGVASGTDALQIALEAAGIGDGAEVITTPFTFIATAESICSVGAKPVFVDIDPKTFNLDPAQVEKAINDETMAIMPVHLFGQPCDMSAIESIAHQYQLKIVEDCAQSFGATINGKQSGTFGDAAGFSFFPSKNLGCFGDSGLVTSNSDEVAEQVRSLRNHGSTIRYHHDRIGYNSRLDEIQALILRIKLKRIQSYNENRRRVAHRYSQLLAYLPVTPPFEDGIGTHVYHQYTLLTDRREQVVEALTGADVASAIYYPIPLHKQDVFRQDYGHIPLPVSEDISRRCLSLPIYPELADTDIDRIVDTIKSVF